MDDWIPVVTAFIIALVGSGAGWAAWRRAVAENAKDNAEAGRAIVGGAGDLAKLLREQMAEMAARLDAQEVRIHSLEVTVGSWEGWAERVLTILDKAMAMLAAEQRAKIETEVARVKKTRPPRTFDVPEL